MAATDVAYLDDIQLEMVDISDRFEVSIRRYEFPYLDGADLEDLGQKARTGRLRCYFFDNVAQATYDDHLALVRHLEKRHLFELNHPKYGVLKVKIDSVDVRHDDRERCAEVDLSYIEQMRGIWLVKPAADVEGAAEAAFSDAVDEQLDEAADDFQREGFDVDQVLDPDQGVFEQVRGGAAYLREVAKEIDGYLTQFKAIASDIEQPTNSVLATINYAATLPGRVIGTVTQAVEREARLLDSLVQFPQRFLRNLDFSFGKLTAAVESYSAKSTPAALAARAVIMKHVKIAVAQRMALEAAYCYAADDQIRRAAAKAEQTPAFDAKGRFIAPGPGAGYLNARELEETLAAVRGRLQQGVDAARSQQALKGMALTLLDNVSSVKLERERVVSVTVDDPTPLHLICLRYGLPYRYAERVRSLNPGITNPNQVVGELLIYTLPGGAA